jgi:hypothetical protein
MSNIVSFDKFKTGRNLSGVMTWFEQFATGPVFMEIIRGAFESHSDVDGEYTLPFSISAPRMATGQSLDMCFYRDDQEFSSLTLGWMAAPAFATFGVIQSMTPTLVETTDQSKAYLQKTIGEMLLSLNVYTNFGGVGNLLSMVVCLLTEMVKRTGMIHEYVAPDGDHFFTAFITADGTDPNEVEPEVLTLRIKHQESNLVKGRLREMMKTQMPARGPSWENVEDGKIRAKIVSSKKPESPLFKRGKDKQLNKWIGEILVEEIVGNDRVAMERYVRNLLCWHEHYATYYNVEGWSYEVTWKG